MTASCGGALPGPDRRALLESGRFLARKNPYPVSIRRPASAARPIQRSPLRRRPARASARRPCRARSTVQAAPWQFRGLPTGRFPPRPRSSPPGVLHGEGRDEMAMTTRPVPGGWLTGRQSQPDLVHPRGGGLDLAEDESPGGPPPGGPTRGHSVGCQLNNAKVEHLRTPPAAQLSRQRRNAS